MVKKMALSIVLAMVLSIPLFNSRAAASSIVLFCLEASCSSMTVMFGGQIHSSKLSCTKNVGFYGVPAGTYSYLVMGCGLVSSNSVYVNGTSWYKITLCPPSGGACCSAGCGSSGALTCSGCQGTTTTSSTTTTSTSSTTTTIGDPFVYVGPSGACGGNTPCYSTIQEAISSAISGDTIMIGQGTYDEDLSLDSYIDLILQGGCDFSRDSQSSDSTSTVNSMAINEDSGAIEIDTLVLQ